MGFQPRSNFLVRVAFHAKHKHLEFSSGCDTAQKFQPLGLQRPSKSVLHATSVTGRGRISKQPALPRRRVAIRRRGRGAYSESQRSAAVGSSNRATRAFHSRVASPSGPMRCFRTRTFTG